MTNKQSRRVFTLDKADSSRWSTCVKNVGDIAHSFEIQFRVDAGRRVEQIARHKKISRVVIRNVLRR
jgi:hypothetical protein